MLSRVIHDLYYLKRIHSVVLDEKLGHALKAKLCALDLRAGPSPGPAALRRLLECLVYFQLEQSAVTMNAVSLVREELPNMSGGQLSRTIAACCTLGQNDISLSAVPLLAEALPSMDSTGTVLLIQSIADAGVRHEDTWALLAEHCIRRMDTFTGRQLYRVIECFYERRVNYPDFYVVAERHICAQPSSYISMVHLSGVIECYRGLGLPVMSLLAASSARSAEGFDSGLAAVAPTRTRRPNRGCGMNSVTSETMTVAALESTSNPAVFSTFLQSTLKAMKTADETQLSDMLHKCEAKQVMHAEIMEAAAVRLQELHKESPNVARTTAIMRLMMRLEKREWFLSASRPLAQLLDECGESGIAVHGHRMLTLADGAMKLFPPDVQPTRFYAALVHDIKFDDIAASMDARRLPLLAGVMISLRAYGGPALLEQHMPLISVAAANAPLRVQVELAAMLAPLPAARKTFLPDLFASLSSQKNWVRALTAREALLLLEGLARSRLPFNDLLLVVVEYTRKNLGRFDAPELVNILMHCAVLGFNDIEFYSITATHVLEKSSNSTVHDLCMLMYVFTFVLKGVIRVVQQMLPRLRVSASHASPRDITLVLYSTVKLGISRHTEVTTPFCDRAVNILPTFKGEELASCMSSLRVLRLEHEGLLTAAAHVLGTELTRPKGAETTSEDSKNNNNNNNRSSATKRTGANDNDDNSITLTETQIISIASAIVQLRRPLLQSEWQAPLQRICLGYLETAGGSQTHLIAVTLAALDAAPCTAEQRERLLTHANAVCESFNSGVVAAEVLLALHDLITREGTDDGRETLAASPLLAYAQANMASIMAATEVRDRLRGKGLLGLLAGVGASFAADEADRVSLREVPLRESLLLHHKTMRRAKAPGAGRFNKSRALKPTSASTTTKMKMIKGKTKSGSGTRSPRTTSGKRGVAAPASAAAVAGEEEGVEDPVATTTRVKKARRGLGVESQGDVAEFRI
ncbi:hypothetical protein DQ04_05121010 [Trypanosoma grayi]|uniref:hypothetical protein n=1 Tax=Trypanosoma grayi TaxID=71804 RepID=UPI0004F40DCD|nr:hypothetical protein DQ04_05121010 [Trypanosoma grayi]KEG09493.1 hypothetical protein DQ04_05121010 [Trypanosoma grayi]